MDDEFKLCWKNFQDNIASGFQNLYDRGDLVDVTLACDGKLLHAHKIVLAICSPYFQEIFITNPCKHPIIILKDVHFNIMCELLEFMYQGVVNVKHTELQSFMKIGQLLQIKGLATNSSTSALSEKSPHTDTQNTKSFTPNLSSDTIANSNVKNETKIDTHEDEKVKIAHEKTDPSPMERNNSPSSSPTPSSANMQTENTASDVPQPYASLKRNPEPNNDSFLIHSKKQLRRSISHDNSAGEQSDEHDNVGSGVDHVSPEDFFLSAIPHITMSDSGSRYDLSGVKREGDHSNSSSSIPSAMRNSFASPFGFEYNLYKNATGSNTGADFSNDHLPNDYSKNFANHMDIPASSSNITMLSSTSLLHGNCVFNRNNTVATQQGMKTYWLCKSYRISMCRARCITHQGRVISATGVHNHPPHMRNGPPPNIPGAGYFNDSVTSGNLSATSANSHCGSIGASNIPPPSIALQSGTAASGGSGGGGGGCSNLGSGGFTNYRATANMFPHGLNIQQQQNAQGIQHHQHQQSKSPPPLHSHLHLTQLSHPNLMIQQQCIGDNNNNNSSLLYSHTAGTTNLAAAPPPPMSQTQSSVIQNMMQNVNIMHLPSMMNAASTAIHSPRMRDNADLGSNQVLTTVSTPTARQQQSPQHSIQSPLLQRCTSVESATSNGRHHHMQSPISQSRHHTNEQHRAVSDGDSSRRLSANITEQVVLVQNAAALSPNYMQSPREIDNDRNSASLAASASESHCNETQIIDSITISPGTGHNFKIEDM